MQNEWVGEWDGSGSDEEKDLWEQCADGLVHQRQKKRVGLRVQDAGGEVTCMAGATVVGFGNEEKRGGEEGWR